MSCHHNADMCHIYPHNTDISVPSSSYWLVSVWVHIYPPHFVRPESCTWRCWCGLSAHPSPRWTSTPQVPVLVPQMVLTHTHIRTHTDTHTDTANIHSLGTTDSSDTHTYTAHTTKLYTTAQYNSLWKSTSLSSKLCTLTAVMITSWYYYVIQLFEIIYYYFHSQCFLFA